MSSLAWLCEDARFSREAAAADVFAVAASRLWANSAVFLRADARSYVLPSLRDLKLCNFKTCDSGLYYA